MSRSWSTSAPAATSDWASRSQFLRRGAAVQQHIEPGGGQPRQAVAGEFHRALERVDAIAELLQFLRHGRIQQLAEFLQGAERFLQPREVGCQDAAGIRAVLLRRRGQRRAHVGLGIAGGQAMPRGQPAQHGRQIVPQTLALLGQMAIVQGEADIILDDAEALAGPVARGVDDPQDLGHRVSPSAGFRELFNIPSDGDNLASGPQRPPRRCRHVLASSPRGIRLGQ